MKKILITGNICSGKSLAVEYLRKNKYYVLDTDEIYHFLLENNSDLKEQLLKNFGKKIFDKEFKLIRKQLGNIVFSDKKKLDLLNKITHPYVYKFLDKILEILDREIDIIFIVIPLYFESNIEFKVDYKILIYTTQKIQMNRLKKRNQLTYKEINKRIKSQMPAYKKKKQVDYVVDNLSTKKVFFNKLKKILTKI